jgi:NAD(P)-dependent dehydrogenase (short-subunit alcohol dehydrogenase family)
MQLRDKVALITGANSGIGAACADRFRADGATVVGLDVTPSDETGFHRVDVRDEPAVAAAINATVQRHGRIDVVVNAAGVGGAGPVHTLAQEEWDRVVDINLKGTYLVSKHVLASMIERRAGSIVNLASIEGLEGMDATSAYNASKGGVVLLTKQMAVDYGRLGIRVNCLCPGFIETPMTTGLFALGDVGDRVAAASLMGRVGQPGEVAAAAAFLASDDASFVTGHALVVDGGLTAGHRFGLAALFGLE